MIRGVGKTHIPFGVLVAGASVTLCIVVVAHVGYHVGMVEGQGLSTVAVRCLRSGNYHQGVGVTEADCTADVTSGEIISSA